LRWADVTDSRGIDGDSRSGHELDVVELEKIYPPEELTLFASFLDLAMAVRHWDLS
jgi:hypothetical protein